MSANRLNHFFDEKMEPTWVAAGMETPRRDPCWSWRCGNLPREFIELEWIAYFFTPCHFVKRTISSSGKSACHFDRPETFTIGFWVSGFNLRKEKHDGNHLKRWSFPNGPEHWGAKMWKTPPHVDSSGLMGTIVWMYGVYYGLQSW